MKAKDMILQYQQTSDKTRALYNVINQLMLDVRDCVAVRRCRTPAALVSVLVEAEDKWEKVAQAVGVDKGLFMQAVAKVSPDFHKLWEKRDSILKIRPKDDVSVFLQMFGGLGR